MAIKRASVIAEIRRELDMRIRVYPRQIQLNRLSSEAAKHRCAMLAAAMGVIDEMTDEQFDELVNRKLGKIEPKYTQSEIEFP